MSVIRVTMHGHVMTAVQVLVVLLIVACAGDVLKQGVASSSSSSSGGGSQTLVNDDRWHTLYLRRQADLLQLIVDDKEATPVTGQLRAK